MSYEQGFMDKCAEYGIDPEQLIKEAARGEQLMKAIRMMKDLPEEYLQKPLATLFGKSKTLGDVENMIGREAISASSRGMGGPEFGLGVRPIEQFYAEALRTKQTQ